MTTATARTSISQCICRPGYTAAAGVSILSPGMCSRYITLTQQSQFASLAQFNSPGIGSVPLPTYHTLGGPNNNGYLNFNGEQYLEAAPRTINMLTNGGFTFVAVFRPTVLTQFASLYNMQGPLAKIYIRFGEDPTQLQFGISGDEDLVYHTTDPHTVSTDRWTTLAIRYNAATTLYEYAIDNAPFASAATLPPMWGTQINVQDGEHNNIHVGKNSYYTGKIAGMFFTDGVLSSEVITQITNKIGQGVDMKTLCDSGSGGAGGGACASCSAGKYKVASGAAACTDCGANTYSEATAASAAATCTTCPGDAGTAVSDAGNGALSGCKCNSGYTGPDGATCSACVAGSYKPATGSAACATCDTGKFSTAVARIDVATCQLCPSNSNTVGGGHDAPGDCTCNAGYTGADGVWCDACVRGKFKSITGSSACLSCAANKYSTVLGSVGGTCTDCPTNTNAPEASSSPAACTCNAGSTGGGGTTACTLCVAGTFKVATGPAACTLCLADWYSTDIGATSDKCQQCPENSMAPPGSDEKTDCVCKPGYTGPNGGPCVACPAGKFKTVQGSAACSDCPSHTYSTATAKTDSTCSSCPTNAVTLQTGSNVLSQCVCNLGFTGPNGGTCTACVAGKFKDATGDAACTLCLANTYQPLTTQVAASSCIACPFANLESPAGSALLTDCQCSAGFFPVSGENGKACSQCFAGRFKPLKGPQACTLCQNGTFSTALAATSDATCQTCHENTESWMGSASRSQCHCVAGYYTENMGQESATCVSCGVGTYNSVLNANACSKCGPGTYSNKLTATSKETCVICPDGFSGEGQSQCDKCPDNAFAGPGKALLTDCQCNPGFFGSNGATCQQCVAGKFKPLHGPMDCDDCLPDKYSVQVGQVADTTCLSCAANTVAPAGSNSKDDCKCKYGHTSSVPGVDGEACEACAKGKFKAAPGHAPCENCGVDKYLETTGATAASACKACFEFSTSSAGSDSEEDCLCIGGRERT